MVGSTLFSRKLSKLAIVVSFGWHRFLQVCAVLKIESKKKEKEKKGFHSVKEKATLSFSFAFPANSTFEIS